MMSKLGFIALEAAWQHAIEAPSRVGTQRTGQADREGRSVDSGVGSGRVHLKNSLWNMGLKSSRRRDSISSISWYRIRMDAAQMNCEGSV